MAMTVDAPPAPTSTRQRVMPPLMRAAMALLLPLLAACASGTGQIESPVGCDISSLRKADYPHDTWCSIKHAALRCSTRSDRCLVECERNGSAKLISGGCSHVCYPQAYTEQDVIDNGGAFWSREAIDCANADAP